MEGRLLWAIGWFLLIWLSVNLWICEDDGGSLVMARIIQILQPYFFLQSFLLASPFAIADNDDYKYDSEDASDDSADNGCCLWSLVVSGSNYWDCWDSIPRNRNNCGSNLGNNSLSCSPCSRIIYLLEFTRSLNRIITIGKKRQSITHKLCRHRCSS